MGGEGTTQKSMWNSGPEGAPSVAAQSILTEDLASFLIFNQLLVMEPETVEDFKESFAGAPDVEMLVDDILVRMEAAGLIEIRGQKITLNQTAILTVDLGSMELFLPNLLKLAAKNAIRNHRADTKEFRKNKEKLFYRALPDDPVTSNEVNELQLEFQAKMRQVQLRAEQEGRKGTGIRFVGMVNSCLKPEDFE